MMRPHVLAAMIAFSVAASLGAASAAEQLNLTQQQKQTIAQDLSSQPSKTAPSGFNAQPGAKVPQSVTLQSLPSNVTNQVASLKGNEFAKTGNDIVIVDPSNREVMAVINEKGSTTGSSTSSGMK